MLDAFIIDKIKKDEERRREERRPCLRLPIYIDEGCEGEGMPEKAPAGERDPDKSMIIIDFS
jgi:hypothetical protein